jgi:hypothetical protein
MINNKKGNIMGILIVVGALFLLVMGGIIMAIGSSTINWVMDETVPELTALGVVGDFNATHAVDATIVPVNTFIQNLTWLSGVVYILGLIGVFGIAFTYRSSGEKWLMGLFFAVVWILIIGCIFMSNIYEDVYDSPGTFGDIMHEHILLSYLVLYSPAIMSIIAFLAGVILFSGATQEASI